MLERIFLIGFLLSIPLLGSGCKPCCEAAGETKSTSTADGTPALTTEIVGQPGCCSQQRTGDSPKAECCDSPKAEKPAGDSPKATCCAKPKAATPSSDPARPLIFTVEGLTCPAVKGLGCGHRLAPVLARLNKIAGVEKSFSNRTGTMIRISVASSADREKVAAAVSEDLTKDSRKPVLLAGNELQAALAKEQWYTPGELSAIEFRTLALHRVKNFAEAEKLDKETTDKLMKIAEREWDCSVKADDGCGPEQQPGEWLNRFKRVATSVPAQAKELLSVEQAERLRQVLTRRFTEKDVPGSAERNSKE
jgi:hypothetical protein